MDRHSARKIEFIETEAYFTRDSANFPAWSNDLGTRHRQKIWFTRVKSRPVHQNVNNFKCCAIFFSLLLRVRRFRFSSPAAELMSISRKHRDERMERRMWMVLHKSPERTRRAKRTSSMCREANRVLRPFFVNNRALNRWSRDCLMQECLETPSKYEVLMVKHCFVYPKIFLRVL